MNGWGLGFVFVIVSLFLYSFFVLLSFFCSLYDSITTLVQIQYIESGVKTINNGASVNVQHTVTACPSGYSWLWVQKESFRVSQTDVNLNGTTFSYKLWNYTGGNSSACYARGWLVFYPSTWNI